MAVLAVPPFGPPFRTPRVRPEQNPPAASWRDPLICVISGRLGWRVGGAPRGTVAQFVGQRHVGFGAAPSNTPCGGQAVLTNIFAA